ncbi:MAG: 4'-phosphopantetheinyl transferase superfamily protein [Pseudohongiella sp.]|uniref:4'-phosphopantetheinyl transferase superfamily protein n=1 Tax=Pseudohongiella sp. TaxID=1979412 RepID=UPI0034A044C8
MPQQSAADAVSSCANSGSTILSGLDLPPVRVDVWLVPAVTEESDVERIAGAWLSVAERERLNGRRLAKGRAMFLLTRAVLRRLLSAYRPDIGPAEWQIGRSAEGRPCVLGPVSAPAFNLSHTDDMLVLVFTANGEPGVDIESLDRQLDAIALAERFFSGAEFQALQALPPVQRQDRFLRLWTLKEACVKANGQGLARALRDFEFDFEEGLRFYPAPQEAPPHRHWRLWSATLSGLRIAVTWRCAEKPCSSSELRVRQLSWPDQVSALDCTPEYDCAL